MDTTQAPQWSEVDANAVQAPASPWGGGGSAIQRAVLRTLAGRGRPLAARTVSINGCRVATVQAPQAAIAQATQTQSCGITTTQATQQVQAECCIDRNSLICLYDLINDDDLAFAMLGVAP